MSALNDLISQLQDESLRNRIQTEVDKLAKQKKFSLVFEDHIPECTPLYDIPVKRGALVELKGGNIKENYFVKLITILLRMVIRSVSIVSACPKRFVRGRRQTARNTKTICL